MTPDAIIIGAGPAGLALAFELKQRGIGSLLLEKGLAAAHSWERMPARLKLVSPWKANWLADSDSRRFPPNRELARGEYAAALVDFARLNELRVVTNAEVQDVSRTADREFAVHTTAGAFTAPLVVNATGYFANPFIPEYAGAKESSIPQFHFANYRDAENLRCVTGRKTGLVLIVGKRLSAGQAMVELIEEGFEVALSHRAPIQFGSGPVGWWLFFRVHPALEKLKLRISSAMARGFPSVMPGGLARRLVESGRVKTFPDITRFEGRRVAFTDGRSLEPDAVLYATGFRPALAHFASLGLTLDERTGQPARRGFESIDVPGLFFLGLDHLRNFRSRFIRGIREDAPLLADELADRLRLRGARLCPQDRPQRDLTPEPPAAGASHTAALQRRPMR